MGIQVAIGFYAWKEDMNIMFICIFGTTCCINFALACVGALIPIIISTVKLSIGGVISSCLVPVVDAAGAYLAWLVYKDFDTQQKMRAQGMGMPGMPEAPMFGGFFGGSG